MSEDMSPNRFAAICTREEGRCAWIGLNLICLAVLISDVWEVLHSVTKYHENADVIFWPSVVKLEFLSSLRQSKVQLTFCNLSQSMQVGIQLLLSLGQFCSPAKINPKAVHDAVDDDETE